MDEEEKLKNSLIGQNPIMEEQPVLNAQDQILGGLGLGGAAFAAQTGQLPTATPQGSLSPFAQQVAANDAARQAAARAASTASQPLGNLPRIGTLNPATGPSGGTTLPSQPSLQEARQAAARSARVNPLSASRLSRFGGPGSLIYGAADLGTELATGRGISERIGEGGGEAVGNLLFSGAQSRPAFTEAETLQELAVDSPSVEGQPEKPGFFQPGGFGYEYLGPRLGENIGQFAGEQLYGTGVTAEGQATGFPVDRPSLLGDIATLPGTALNVVGDFVTDPLIAGGELAKDAASYVTGASGVEAQQAAQEDAKAAEEAQGQQGTPNVNQVLQDGIGPFQPGAVDFSKPPTIIRQGEEGSPQKAFNDIISERPLTPEEIRAGEAFADRRGFDFNPQTGFSTITDPGSRTFDTPATLENFRNRGLSLGQFMRYEDDPSQRTEQFVDPQGRLRRRLTPSAAALQGFEPGQQPLAPEFAQAEATGDQMIADLRAREAAERGEGKMSYTDAKIRARGQFAARNIDPSSSQLRDLARSIQAAEPERLEGLETEKAINEARIKTAEAELNRPEFKGRVYTVNGVTFAQTSRGGVQVISTGTEDPEAATAKMKDFEFTKKKIEEAREAYLAGDLTKANDILTAAKVQQYGIQANATQYFADSTPSGTGSGLTPQQEANITRQAFDTIEEAEAANLPKGTKITIGGRNATV